MSTARAARAILEDSEGYFTHPDARVETEAIGPRTRIWAFAHVLKGARIGADCNLCDRAHVEAADIGDRVTLKCGVQIAEGVILEDDVFIGPNVVFANDLYPRSKRHLASYPRTRVGRGASIGANATIGFGGGGGGLRIGPMAMIGAGAVVTRDVLRRAPIVVGNPELRFRDMSTAPGKDRVKACAASGQTVPARTGGARLYHLPRITGDCGTLSFAELNQSLPFPVSRYFLVFGVPGRQFRGEHAHRTPSISTWSPCMAASRGDACLTGSTAKKSCWTVRNARCTCPRWCGPRSTNTRPTRCCWCSHRISIAKRIIFAISKSIRRASPHDRHRAGARPTNLVASAGASHGANRRRLDRERLAERARD